MMQCPNCGTENQFGEVNCVACGAPLPQVVEPPFQPQPPQSQPPYSPPPPPYQPSNYLPPTQFQTPYYPPPQYASSKSKTTAGVLAIFLGGFGAHKFYLGQTGIGILYLLFFWSGIPAIIGLIEGIIYLSMSDSSFAEKYH
jgi:TM2 domain-containing membrane protein YozV